MILAGRETNEMVPMVIAKNLLKNLKQRKLKLNQAKGLILGATFKENCPDFRNSKVVDLVRFLKKSFKYIDIYDPYFAISKDKNHKYAKQFKSLSKIQKTKYDFIIIAVAHKQFKKLFNQSFNPDKNPNTFIYDLKGILSVKNRDLTL